MNTTTVAVSNCPQCGERVDRATGAGHDHKPKPGDISVCFYCAAVLVLDERLAVREAELNDLVTLDPETRRLLDQTQAAVKRYRNL